MALDSNKRIIALDPLLLAFKAISEMIEDISRNNTVHNQTLNTLTLRYYKTTLEKNFRLF